MDFIPKNIHDYAVSKSNRPSESCDQLEKYTRANVDIPQMLIGQMEASFLGFLLRSIDAKRVLEVGTYTGYSALAMAEQLPEEAELITLDINPETNQVAKEYWAKSPHGNKITAILGPALESIPKLTGQFDLAFIDADKTNYSNYLKAILPLLSSRGMIVIDNVLWSGSVLEAAKDDSTRAIQEVNDFVTENSELYGTLLPIRDGMFLIKKRLY
jgi:caffeoyl-CoA O-methyltransferase